MSTDGSDDSLLSVAPANANREHGWLVKASCFCGFFLLFCAAGCIGSSALLAHNENVARTRWPEAAGRVRGCHVRTFAPTIRLGAISEGESYALLCQIDYPFGGRIYRSALFTTLTRSRTTRTRLADWAARNSPETELIVRIDPASPYDFVVESPVPFHHGSNPDDYLYAAIVLGAIGFTLVGLGRKLIRSGW